VRKLIRFVRAILEHAVHTYAEKFRGSPLYFNVAPEEVDIYFSTFARYDLDAVAQGFLEILTMDKNDPTFDIKRGILADRYTRLLGYYQAREAHRHGAKP